MFNHHVTIFWGKSEHAHDIRSHCTTHNNDADFRNIVLSSCIREIMTFISDRKKEFDRNHNCEIILEINKLTQSEMTIKSTVGSVHKCTF